MPYTPDEQRIVDHIEDRIGDHLRVVRRFRMFNGQARDEDDYPPHILRSLAVFNELQTIKDLMEDIKATRDKEYPCGQKGE